MRLALRMARWVVLLFLLVFLTAVMILTLGRIDVRASGEGSVTHLDSRTVRSPVEGCIEKVFIREGDRLDQGRPLIRIDHEPFRQRQIELEDKLRDIEQEQEICRSTRKRLLQVVHRQELLQVEQKSFQAGQQLSEAETKLQRLQKLAKEGIASQEELDEAGYRLEILRSGCQYLEAERELMLNRHAAALEDLDNRETALAGDRAILEQQLTLASRDLEKALITAPISGIVLTREPERLVDKWVVEGESLIDLGPSDEFVFRTMVPDRDVRDIEPEMEVKIALAAFPHRQYGYFTGKVLSISLRPLQVSGQSFYLVDCSIAPTQLEVEMAGRKTMIPIKLGMTGEANIILRNRIRIITYLWEKVTEAASI